MIVQSDLRFLLPAEPARGGWVIDPTAMEVALDELSIERFVNVRYTDGRRIVGRHGPRYYRYPDFGGPRPGIFYHRIKLSQDAPFERACLTIWHELAHARQAENFVRRTGYLMTMFYNVAYKEGRGPWGASYRENIYEEEARMIATNRPFEILREIGG